MGAVAVLLLAASAAIVSVPAILANNAGRVSDGTHAFPLTNGAERASILVPAGWIVIRSDDSALVLRSPDDAFSARAELVVASDDEAMATLAEAETGDAVVGTWRRETLGSGLRVSHADVTGAANDLLAVVSVGGAEADTPVVTIVADVAEGRDPALYRPAVAEILAGVSR